MFTGSCWNKPGKSDHCPKEIYPYIDFQGGNGYTIDISFADAFVVGRDLGYGENSGDRESGF